MQLPEKFTHLMITPNNFETDISINFQMYNTDYNLYWKIYNKNMFFTQSWFSDEITSRVTELFFGNNNFCITKTLEITDTREIIALHNFGLSVTDTLNTKIQSQRKFISNILSNSKKIYPDLINIICKFISY